MANEQPLLASLELNIRPCNKMLGGVRETKHRGVNKQAGHSYSCRLRQFASYRLCIAAVPIR